MTVRGYNVAFDWSRDGTYTGTLEDVSSYVNGDVEFSYGRGEDLFSPQLPASELDVVLRNDGKQFSPENAGSPIAGLVGPGVPFRLQYLTGGTFSLYSGVLDDYDVDPNAAGRDFTAKCLDAWGRPAGERLSTPLYKGIRTGTAFGHVLDAIGWTGARDLDAGATVMPFWWSEDDDAATAIEKLLDSEGLPALAYVKGGTFVFRDRLHRLTRSASLTSQGTYTNVIASSPPAGAFRAERGSYRYTHGLKRIVNSVTFSIEERAALAPGEVWNTDDPIGLGASEATSIHVQMTDPFSDAETPADADIVLLSGSVTATLSRTSGQSLIINLTAGAGGAIISRLAVRATSYPVARTVKVAAEDATSVSTRGRHAWQRTAPYANKYDAKAIADSIVDNYAGGRPVVVLTIDSGAGTGYLTQILARVISDRITIRDDDTGVNDPYIIERATHSIRGLGLAHRLTLVCQQADASAAPNLFTFDTAGKGFNQGVFAE